MNPDPHKTSDDDELFYSLEIIAEMTGISPKTVLHYRELGVISPVTDDPKFDTEGLRQLRRLEHLRHTYELTDSGLKFISGLLSEVEQLRHELRKTRA